MNKVAIAVIIILIGAGFVFIKSQSKTKPVVNKVPQQIIDRMNQVAPINTALETTDESIDSDLTALDKDISNLQQDNQSLDSELNKI